MRSYRTKVKPYTIFDRKVTPFAYLPLKNDAFFEYLSNGRLGTSQKKACRHFHSNVGGIREEAAAYWPQ